MMTNYVTYDISPAVVIYSVCNFISSPIVYITKSCYNKIPSLLLYKGMIVLIHAQIFSRYQGHIHVKL